MTFLILTLQAGLSQSGHERNALLAINTETGALAGAQRYDEHTTPEDALEVLMRREAWESADITIGPEFMIPARELFRLTDEATARARRDARAAEAMARKAVGV